MRTSRLRQRIKKYLLENGQANTTEISEYVNSTMRHGCTMQQLGNVLSKDKDITKVGTIRKAGSLSGRYEMCIWSLSSHYAVETEQTYNELKDKIIQWLDTQEPGTYLPKQIKKGKMATVIGIFEDAYKNKKPLPVVRPGTQSRKFTHIYDTIKVCFYAWRQNRCRHYSISNKKNYTILEVAKLFNSNIKFLPMRKGERYASALTNMNLSNKVYKIFGKIELKEYVKEFIKSCKD